MATQSQSPRSPSATAQEEGRRCVEWAERAREAGDPETAQRLINRAYGLMRVRYTDITPLECSRQD